MKSYMSKLMINSKFLVAGVTALLSLGTAHSVTAVEFSQSPLFLAQPVRPIVMMNISNDHQLFFKAYDDFSDLTGDGFANTTYTEEVEYYGYFDSQYCYTHTNGVFVKATPTTSDYFCSAGSGHWSGNFLNWATMTRIDVTRKILYGGKRSEDGADQTILERAFIPADAHAFVKYYNGTNMNKLTPHNYPGEGINNGISICNVSTSSDGDPVMRVAKGNYSLWDNNERYQCYWSENVPASWTDKVGKNGNNSTYSGILAHGDSPSTSVKLNELAVRVQVCESDKILADNKENCRAYGAGNLKPSGVLHTHGENDSLYFGLITGSYMKNKSGGVLRSNVGSFTDEVNLATGQFIKKEDEPGIVGTLDALRIVDYDFSGGTYGNCGNPNVNYGKTDEFPDGKCVNWGNPQSEIYSESLRYLAGADGATGAFDADDTSKVAALTKVEWSDPITEEGPNANYCAPLGILQFNASTSSYDGDNLATSNINLSSTLNSMTNKVGAAEGIHGNSYFVGENGSSEGDPQTHQLCTAKTVGSLSSVLGTCPDAPRLGGSYQIAGLAYHARVNGVHAKRETVRTFGVALAPAVPKIEVNDQGVIILPACRAKRNGEVYTNCGLVDFKVVEESDNYGKYLVSWEDAEQGGDYDQDLLGTLEYTLDGDGNITVTTLVFVQSTDDPMAFGYVISGTDMDGFHAHSGLHNFAYDDPYADILACGRNGTVCHCNGGGNYGACAAANIKATSQAYKITSGSAQLLEQPLYYAAKWGGFDTEEDSGNPLTEPPDDSNPTYYFATNPRELERSLHDALDTYKKGAGAAASVAANSTRLGTDTFIYQATFNSEGWFGSVVAKGIGSDGAIGADEWNAGALLPGNHTARTIYTSDGSSLVDFTWDKLTDDQRTALINQDDEELGKARLLWLRGASVNGLRDRENHQRMGDIVNSDPVFFGTRNYGFAKLTSHGGGQYNNFADAKTAEVLYVQANDGKLHALNAKDGTEIFAYVPNGIYDKLADITAQSYGSSVNGHVFTADGQITVSDVYDGTNWRTILAAGLGAGGKGVYVLDVTIPSSPKLMGELSGPDIGHVTGKPAVVPLPSGKWAVVFGNGYKAGSSNTAKLVVAEINGGSVNTPTFINTNATAVGDNGLAEPEFTVTGDGAVGFAYAGDLMGDMWRFDLSTNTASKLFDGSPDQPITVAPTLGLNFIKRDEDTGQETTMVYFGTGRYMSGSDLNPDNVAIQSFYGLADTGTTLTKQDLQENLIVTTGTTRQVQEAQNETHPTVTDFDWKSEDANGWYVDFPKTGERVVTKAMLLFDRLIFPTIVPTDNMCDYGGKSWIMELVGVGNLYPGHQMLENQGMQNETLVSLSDLILGENSQGDGVIIQQNSDGSLESIKVKPPAGAFGRQSWRQLR